MSGESQSCVRIVPRLAGCAPAPGAPAACTDCAQCLGARPPRLAPPSIASERPPACSARRSGPERNAPPAARVPRRGCSMAACPGCLPWLLALAACPRPPTPPPSTTQVPRPPVRPSRLPRLAPRREDRWSARPVAGRSCPCPSCHPAALKLPMLPPLSIHAVYRVPTVTPVRPVPPIRGAGRTACASAGTVDSCHCTITH